MTKILNFMSPSANEPLYIYNNANLGSCEKLKIVTVTLIGSIGLEPNL